MKNSITNLSRRKSPKKVKRSQTAPPDRITYPFSAIVGQAEMKLSLVLNVINPTIGGVVIMGQRGTGKSTAVRALAALLPAFTAVHGCVYRCDPNSAGDLCDDCARKQTAGLKISREQTRVPVVDLPLGATEDRVCGTIDIERALRDGTKTFEPGLLARANRGFLYIDEVNLLEDHLVDLLLDVAVTGRNKVERESISVEHPARFVLIGSGNPEEGELRPQLLDRFGLHVEVQTENDFETRAEVVERREAFDLNPALFSATFKKTESELRKSITQAQRNLGAVTTARPTLEKIARLCEELKIDGHRGELTISRAARALAALEGRKSVSVEDVKRVAGMALRHRLRRDPFEEASGTQRIQQALDRVFEDAGSRKGSSPKGNGGTNGTAPKRGSQEASADTARVLSRSASPSGMETADLATSSEPTNPESGPAPQFPSQLDSRRHDQSHPITRAKSRAGRPEKNVLRGRYVRAVTSRTPGNRVAIDATLRAAAAGGFDHLRFKQLSHKSGRLFIFAIDTSGSMALNRISQAKGAVLNLLRQSYIKRDSVALLAFRGTFAEVLLPPSRSILRARRSLDSLGVGGGTPLSAALVSALELARRSQNGFGEIVLVLFTDGGGNVALDHNKNSSRAERRLSIEREVTRLGAELMKAHVTSVVVDTQKTFGPNDETRVLAQRLRANLISLPSSNKSPF